MAPDDIKDILSKKATLYQLNPAWIMAIISQESQWNMYATRYESNYQYLYETQKFAKGLISLATEIATQRISWGLGQIMGALAREQGHTGFMAELLKPEVNITHICIHLSRLKKISDQPSDVFAMYNAGNGAIHKLNGQYLNQNYVNSTLGYLQKFQG